MSNSDSIINWIDEDTFEVDITLSLRKASVNSIVTGKDYIEIWFLDDDNLKIHFSDLNNLEKVIERALLRWHGGYEGQGLLGSVIDKILNHFKEHIKEIKEGINKIRLNR